MRLSLLYEGDESDDSLYDELDDNNEYLEDGERQPTLDRYITVGDYTIQQWIVGANEGYPIYDYKILKSGRVLNTDRFGRREYNILLSEVLAYMLDSSEELRRYAMTEVEKILKYYKDNNMMYSYDYTDECLEFYEALKNIDVSSNPKLAALVALDEMMEACGSEQLV